MTELDQAVAQHRRPAPPRPGRRSRVFHGWRIVGVLAVTETISWGILYYAFAVFQVPIGKELGLSPAELTGAFSLGVLGTGVAGVWVGRWLDAHGPRGLMTAGAIVSALLVAAWSQVHTAWHLYLVLAGIGVTRAAVLYDPAFAVVVRWFHHDRSKALLAVTVVAGFASTIALPTANALTQALGWRDALLALAAAVAALTALPHWLVLRRDPADLGLHPDGARCPPPPPEEAAPSSGDRGPRLRVTASWAARHAALRWYAAAFAAQAAAVVVVSVHLIPVLLEYGHDPAFAAATTGALGVLSVTGRLVLTGAVRRLHVSAVAAVMFVIQGSGVLALLLGGGSRAGALAFVLLFGLGYGVGTVARPALLAQTFGVASYATVSGLIALVITVATTTGPLAAGVVRTSTGTYTPVLLGVGGLCAFAAVSLLRAGRPVIRGRPAGSTSTRTRRRTSGTDSTSVVVVTAGGVPPGPEQSASPGCG